MAFGSSSYGSGSYAALSSAQAVILNVSGSKPAFIYSVGNVVVAKNAFIAGYSNTTASKSAFIDGSIALTGSKAAYIPVASSLVASVSAYTAAPYLSVLQAGYGDLEYGAVAYGGGTGFKIPVALQNTLNAYIQSAQIVSKSAYMFGVYIATASKLSFISGGPMQQSQPCYVVGSFRGLEPFKLVYMNGSDTARQQYSPIQLAYIQSGITQITGTKLLYVESTGSLDCWPLNDGLRDLNQISLFIAYDANGIDNGSYPNGASPTDGPAN